MQRRWPDLGRVRAANAGSTGTVVAPEDPEGQGNSPLPGLRVRPANPPVVGSSPTGPTTRISVWQSDFRYPCSEGKGPEEASWPVLAGYARARGAAKARRLGLGVTSVVAKA